MFDALFALGKAYETGAGTEKDLESAKIFYQLAVASGASDLVEEAQQALDKLNKKSK